MGLERGRGRGRGTEVVWKGDDVLDGVGGRSHAFVTSRLA